MFRKETDFQFMKIAESDSGEIRVAKNTVYKYFH